MKRLLKITKSFVAQALNSLAKETTTIRILLSHRPPSFAVEAYLAQRIRAVLSKTSPNRAKKSNEILAELEEKGLSLSHDWFTRHIPSLVEVREKLSQKRNVKILEIGSFEGLSTVGLSLLFQGSQITAVDTWEGSPENLDPDSPYYSEFSAVETAFDRNTRGILGLAKLKQTSLQFFSGSNSIPERNGELFDVVYIDGSHEAIDVLIDGLLAFQALGPGGILIFDDYAWNPKPRPAGVRHPAEGINSFLRFLDRGDFKILSVGYQIAILKKANS
jgi:predicted O-methyltransferase YrrM